MKILFVGVLDVPWSTNIPMQRALERLGHQVEAFNYRTIARRHCADWYAERALAGILDKVASYLRRYDWLPFGKRWYFSLRGRGVMNRGLLDMVRNGAYDLVLLAKTDSVDYALLDQINPYSKTWYFFMDPMDQAHRINAKEYARRATWASATFSDVTQYFQQAGARAYWIPQGIDTDRFSPAAVEKKHDVVFVGTKNPKRSALIQYLREHGVPVTCYGNGWENGPIFLDELVNLYRRTTIVLNIRRPGAGFSVRVFQVMGTGAFLLSEYCPDFGTFFKRGVHLDWFKDKKEVVAKIRYFLQHKEELEHIAEAGCWLVHKRHSWRCVLRRIFDIMNRWGEEG